ncbi:hypothetical protein F441_11260 [Phytophthora nicotianae CJ01A1]|uniref:Uncharacterized protein n=7 Tax=Phytophthora nicotianae TaxID=4792 RepID=V9F040_PHYNI|nr:hypothetical protein F443_11343 [Phytophthora nicotianae P1569]ETK88930.1 hypothetical protein L915_06904 [Phytophthora nicotianae]ETO72396.1 hypothetical protein F444_11411 [Phytophthora nicotianae P1976]ETP13533.1 hypothetical protein F441_11260 [Phytophthora nicotianae CJ01A1]ETP46769.1 hypothetical protein F442_07065 [Phytophthora nicotianae P10297]
MSKYHNDALDEFRRLNSDDTEGPTWSSSDTNASQVVDGNKKPGLCEITVEQQQKVNVLIAKWIAAHFRPLLMVEDDGFVTFIKFVTEDICGIKLRFP